MTVGFMVTQQNTVFDQTVVDTWQTVMAESAEFTEKFLVPFQKVAALEYSKTEDGQELTPWMLTGEALLGPF